jgi:hypothetical protein
MFYMNEDIVFGMFMMVFMKHSVLVNFFHDREVLLSLYFNKCEAAKRFHGHLKIKVFI